MHGKDFIEHPEIHNPELLQTEYDFVRKEPDDGFENRKLFLIRYTKDYEVIKVEDDEHYSAKVNHENIHMVWRKQVMLIKINNREYLHVINCLYVEV